MGKHVEVYVDLDDFDDDELVDELESRGIYVDLDDTQSSLDELGQKIIYEKIRGRDVTLLIDQLLYKITKQAITGF